MRIFAKHCDSCGSDFYASTEEIHGFRPNTSIPGEATEEQLKKAAEMLQYSGRKCVTCPICEAELFLVPVPAEPVKNEKKSTAKAKAAVFESVKK